MAAAPVDRGGTAGATLQIGCQRRPPLRPGDCTHVFGVVMREVIDEAGRQWRVWEVRPASGRPPAGAERRAKARATVREELRQGWLVFESATTGDRIRLAPVPPGWRDLPDDELLALRHRGTRVTGRRRLLE